MNLNKICPDCETEYLPNIGRCADCGTVLVLHEELRQAQEEKSRLAEQAVEDAVMVREGDLKWLGELYTVLIDAGIPCTVTSNAGCNTGRCKDTYQLIVSAENRERAKARIEEYFTEIHPEMLASNELASQGKCPACGSATRESDIECSDCGLSFVIVEEEED